MEKDRLQYTIGRFDHYFDSINNKTAVYIAINTFLIGGILASYSSVDKYIIQYSTAFNLIISLELLIGIAALIILVYASIPYFTKSSDSLIYFGSIGSKSKDDFYTHSKKCDEEEEINDLRDQVYALSKGLTKKFSRLKLVGVLLATQFIFLIPLIIIFLANKF